MSDHADTIRRIRLRAEETLEREILHNNERRLARDVLTVVSARLQAINERDGFRADCEKLVAERQQAIDDAAKWKECFESASQSLDATAADWNAEKARCEQAIDALRDLRLRALAFTYTQDDETRDELDAAIERAECLTATDRARCEQAIDALREIADHVPGRYVVQSPDYVQLRARARAALLSLGEQP